MDETKPIECKPRCYSHKKCEFKKLNKGKAGYRHDMYICTWEGKCNQQNELGYLSLI